MSDGTEFILTIILCSIVFELLTIAHNTGRIADALEDEEEEASDEQD